MRTLSCHFLQIQNHLVKYGEMCILFFLLLVKIINCLRGETSYLVNNYLLSSAIIGKVHAPPVDTTYWLNTADSSESDVLV